MLKVNVPARCVDLDSSGNPVANSFDAEQLQDDDDDEESGDRPKSKVVRLVMRQDSTLRVILNTAVLPTMQFQKRQTLKAMTVGFTAFEAANPRPVPIQLKARTFRATSCALSPLCRCTTNVTTDERGELHLLPDVNRLYPEGAPRRLETSRPRTASNTPGWSAGVHLAERLPPLKLLARSSPARRGEGGLVTSCLLR